MTTDWNLWKTGLMAIDGSMQLGGAGRHDGNVTRDKDHFVWAEVQVQLRCKPHLKCSTGLAIVGVLSSKGSMMMVKPSDNKRSDIKS